MGSKFTYDAWDFDSDGTAYIIAKSDCPEYGDVPDYIIDHDHIDPDCKSDMIVQEGWCKYQVRSDWANLDGEPAGGYYVTQDASETQHSITGKRKCGWFPVWIVRQDEWY